MITRVIICLYFCVSVSVHVCVLHSAPCHEILLWFLGQVDPPMALASLKHLSGLEGEAGRGVGGAPGFHFTPGSEGGAKLSPRETVR